MTTELHERNDPGLGSAPGRPTTAALPAWPFTWAFALFPLWWVLGLVDVMTIVMGFVMALYLALVPGIRVPRGFALWLGFLVFMLCSATELVRGSQLIVFSYRAALYLATTVLLVYVYNAKASLPDRRVLSRLTIYWGTTVAGGLLGLVYPTGSLTTPAYYALNVVAPGLLNNQLVRFMVVRQFSQYFPNSYFQIPPRPAAPFLYTNNWGNAYSLLLPLVLVFLMWTRRRSATRAVLLVLLPLSAIPAILTLNRGMFLGLGLAGAYAGLRLALRGHVRALAALVAVAVVGGGLFALLPAEQGLQTRVQVSTTTRSSLYEASLQEAQGSPMLGYGAPIRSDSAAAPPVGTQGQLWMVLVSHGVPATVCFVGFFGLAFWRTRKRTDMAGLAYNTVLLVGTVELFYYGVIPYGLPLMMTVVALALRAPRPAAPVATR